MILNRQEKEKLVLDLYYNQNKSYHQIAKEARICPRDIKAILEKPVKEMELKQSVSVSSQAYKLFSEDKKSPLQVAIALNLRDAQVTELYKEYWNLCHLHDLNQVHEEIKGDMTFFLEIYRLARAAGMNPQRVINLLKIANNYLPSVEYRYEKLKREEVSLQTGNHNSARTFQELSDQISDLRNTRDSYRLSCEEEKIQMAELLQKKMKLEALVNDFQDNNEEYVKIKQTVKREVEITMADRRQLLKLAVLSIFESLRKDPRKFYALYYNMSFSSSAKSSSSSFSPKTTGYDSSQQYDYMPFMNEQNLSIIDYSNEDICEKILLDESEALYDKMVQDLTNKTINDTASNSESSSSLSQTEL
jgi:hypothetical protein